MVYSPAFDGLPPAIKQAVHARMRETMAKKFSPEDADAVTQILKDTKRDFAAYGQR
jgi:hypothetical protein